MKAVVSPRSGGGTRVRRAGLVLVTACALVGCGEPAAPAADPWLRVEITGSTTDRPWPTDGYRLRSVEGREIVLAPVVGAKAEGPVLEGRGAPGRYRLVAPAAWRVSDGGEATEIRPDEPPVKFGIGRPRTFYAWPPAGSSISAIRCTRQPTSDAPIVALDGESRIGDDGSAAITLPASEWRGTLVVHALLGASRFAVPKYVVVDARSVDQSPIGLPLDPALSSSVSVRVVRAPASDTTTPVELMASVAAEPLKVGLAVPLDSKGRGVLEEVPREVSALSLFVRGTQAWDGLEAARLYRDVRLLVVTAPPQAQGTLEARLSKVVGDAHPVLQVRAEDGTTYAMPSFTQAREGSDAHVMKTSLPAGRWRVLVTAGTRGAESEDAVDVRAGERTTLELVATDLPTIRAALVGGVRAVPRWDFLVRRLEGGREVEGQGFLVRGLARPDVDLQVPHGRYRACAVVGGDEAAPVDVDVSSPGTQASIDVKPRR